MISNIYFSDSYIDKIECELPDGVKPRILTGLPGLTKIFGIVDSMVMDENNWALFTNDPLIVDYAMEDYWYYCGHTLNESRNPYEITFIYDFHRKTFVPITETTTKDLRVTHKFSNLWLGYTFVDTKNNNK